MTRIAGFGWVAAGLAAAMVALGLGDLSFVHRDLNPTAPADFYRARPALLAEGPPPDGGRFLVLDYSSHPDWPSAFLKRPRPYLVPAQPGPRQLWTGAMALRLYPVAPLLAAWRVPGSYSRDLLGLLPPPLVAMNDALVATFPDPAFVRLLGLGGVTRLATLHDVETEGLVLRRRLRGPFFEDEREYEVAGALPRAYVAGAASGTASLEALLDPGFDASHRVFVDGATAETPPPNVARAAVVESRPDRVRIDVETDDLAIRVQLLDQGLDELPCARPDVEDPAPVECREDVGDTRHGRPATGRGGSRLPR